MAWREVNPADLEGEALRRWYLRSPDDVERRQRAASDARYQAFFAPQHLPEPPSAFRPAGEPSQGARGFSINSDIGFSEDDPGWPPTWHAGGSSGWGDEVPRAKGGARPVPLSSPALGRKDEGSQPFPLSPISLPAGGSRPAPLSPIFASHPPSSAGFSTAAAPVRSMSDRPEQPATPKEVSQQASATRPPRHGIWIAGRQPGELDPSRTEVFQRGPDGKLHAVPGWRTTGPFEFGEWSRMFDWGGVAGDLTDITTGALDFMGGGGLAGEIVKGLGYTIGPDIVRGMVQGHHAWAKFLGGPAKQELARLHQSLHAMLHRDLAAELKAAGFPRVGGRGGSITNWAEYFAENPGRHDEAIAILQRVTLEFDRKNGTKVSKYLDEALARGKASASPPSP